ncbi:MAG: DNA-directed RNA polymerase subunit omega [Rubrobacteraceae bacterium]
MLSDLKIDELLGKVDSRYGLAMASAKRARQINEYTATLGLNDTLGIPGPQVHTRSQHPLSIAIEELREDKLTVGFRDEVLPEDAVAQAQASDTESPETEVTEADVIVAEDEAVEDAEGEAATEGDTEATDSDQGAA